MDDHFSPKIFIECDKDTAHVIGLNLGNNYLYGSINSSSTSSTLCIFKGLIYLITISVPLRSHLELSSFWV